MRLALDTAGEDTRRTAAGDGSATPVVSLFQGEGHFERSVQFLNLGASQGPNQAGQLHLAETYEVVAQRSGGCDCSVGILPAVLSASRARRGGRGKPLGTWSAT